MILNADLGESWKHQRIGNDAALMPLLDRCNIACGFHGGDALTMQKTIDLALKHGVGIGAHPSFPDRKNFGRQRMDLPLDELEALLLYQVSALSGMVRANGSRLQHIKPHGALYHYLNEVPEAAEVLVRVAKKLGMNTIFGPPDGYLQGAAAGAGLTFMSEGFADRRYGIVTAEGTPTAPGSLRDSTSDWSTKLHEGNTKLHGVPRQAADKSGREAPQVREENKLHLLPRSHPSATITSPTAAATQVRRLITQQEVVTVSGQTCPLHVQTVCIHGDHDGAVARARAVRAVLDEIR